MNIKSFSLFLTTTFLLANPLTVKADDCSIKASAQESARCLERKLNQLEKAFADYRKKHVSLPKGAIVELKATSCPNGWAKYQQNDNGIVNLNTHKNVVKCEKIN